MKLPDALTLEELRDLAREAEEKARTMNQSTIILEAKCRTLGQKGKGSPKQ